MPIRFQADADLNQTIVSAVARRVPAIDFRTAVAAGLASLHDHEVLAVAAHDGRILVTHDQATMPRHFGEFARSQRSPGLIVVPQHLPVGGVADDLILIWTATEAEEWAAHVEGLNADPSASGAARLAGSANFKRKYEPALPIVAIEAAQRLNGREVPAAFLLKGRSVRRPLRIRDLREE